jgi:hypothetical protein
MTERIREVLRSSVTNEPDHSVEKYGAKEYYTIVAI